MIKNIFKRNNDVKCELLDKLIDDNKLIDDEMEEKINKVEQDGINELNKYNIQCNFYIKLKYKLDVTTYIRDDVAFESCGEAYSKQIVLVKKIVSEIINVNDLLINCLMNWYGSTVIKIDFQIRNLKLSKWERRLKPGWYSSVNYKESDSEYKRDLILYFKTPKMEVPIQITYAKKFKEKKNTKFIEIKTITVKHNDIILIPHDFYYMFNHYKTIDNNKNVFIVCINTRFY